MKLIQIHDLKANDIHAIWALANQPVVSLNGNVAWSFEGNGIRTRTSFIAAFRELGLAFTELPNLLKTSERACDLAAYLDPYYQLYVVRESNHQRLQEFALASSRPVINAMSGVGHPCEVLADACYINDQVGDISKLRIGLWGPLTNVLHSWHELAEVLGFSVHHFCPQEFHRPSGQVRYHALPATGQVGDMELDVLITDSWPASFEDNAWSLTQEHMASLGHPWLLPTPPFSVGREIGFDPATCSRFFGYHQKQILLPVQRAILTYMVA